MVEDDKKSKFNENQFKEKFEKAVNSFKEGQNVINVLDKSLDEINEVFEPIYNAAKKTSRFLKKFQYVIQTLILAQNLAPYIQKMLGKKEFNLFS